MGVYKVVHKNTFNYSTYKTRNKSIRQVLISV